MCVCVSVRLSLYVCVRMPYTDTCGDHLIRQCHFQSYKQVEKLKVIYFSFKCNINIVCLGGKRLSEQCVCQHVAESFGILISDVFLPTVYHLIELS